MPSTEKLDTHRKALTLTLDTSKFGSFAEIGAGQEVARWFLTSVLPLVTRLIDRVRQSTPENKGIAAPPGISIASAYPIEQSRA
jgi:hypothetical protein